MEHFSTVGKDFLDPLFHNSYDQEPYEQHGLIASTLTRLQRPSVALVLFTLFVVLCYHQFRVPFHSLIFDTLRITPEGRVRDLWHTVCISLGSLIEMLCNLFLPSATADHSLHNARKHVPELEESQIATNHGREETLRKSASSRRDRPIIEPAFLDPQKYPPGWLVYHPTLGIIAKSETGEGHRNDNIRKRTT